MDRVREPDRTKNAGLHDPSSGGNSRGGWEKILTLALDRWVVGPRFSPDGKSIVFILEDDATRTCFDSAGAGR